MADSIDQLRVSFVEETRDLINELEDILLSLEVDTVDNETIDLIFRSIHTVKGSGGMLGFEKVLAVTHDLEDIYDKVRAGEMKFSTELKDISLETIDILKTLLATDEKLNEAEKIKFNNICRKIENFEIGSDTGGNSALPDIDGSLCSLPYITYIIQLKPESGSIKDLSHPGLLVHELSFIGNCLAFALSGNQVKVNTYEKVNKGSKWKIILSTNKPVETIEDIFEWVKNELNFEFEKICEGNLLGIEEAKEEILKLDEKVFNMKADDFFPVAEKYSSLLQKEKNTDATQNDETKAGDDASTLGGTINSIRVATDKVDQLMNLVSEMVTLQARLNLIAHESGNEELIAVAEKYGTFSNQLRDNAFTISLVPFGVTITRYKRMVHDLCEQLDKKVEFITEGEDTVLDKKIIERLSDPIMHILRNSIDHGIESTEDRKKANKNLTGKIYMKIFHQSNNVIIKIIDDGRGVNLERTREIAIEKKIITPDQTVSENELLSFLFLPGFSSAKTISNVSGRGVGLDVVKRNISDIRGSIEIHTEQNVGTTFTIKLPLTLSIIDGLQVKIDYRDFIIPLVQVEKIISLTDIIEDTELSQVMKIDGTPVPYFDLRSDFGITSAPPARREVVLVSYENEHIALIVDYVVGENQTVLKPLGKHYKNQDFLSGGTILGDGSVALVIDVNRIVTTFSKK